jgi:hypothetical protein
VTIPPSLETVLSRIGETQIPLPPPIALFIGILVFIAVLGPTLWKVTTHVNTVVHEGAHALVGLGNGGGGTKMEPNRGFGYGVAAFAGYIGSSAAGLLAAWLISIGHILAVLWLGGLLLVAMVLMVRNLFGAIVILACGALLYLILRYTTAGAETAVAYGLTWFLLLSAPKDALSVAKKPKTVEDAKILAGMTFLWPSAWCFLWLAGTIAALIVGTAILV